MDDALSLPPVGGGPGLPSIERSTDTPYAVRTPAAIQSHPNGMGRSRQRRLVDGCNGIRRAGKPPLPAQHSAPLLSSAAFASRN